MEWAYFIVLVAAMILIAGACLVLVRRLFAAHR
jgi:hypothetical protein